MTNQHAWASNALSEILYQCLERDKIHFKGKKEKKDSEYFIDLIMAAKLFLFYNYNL